VAADQSAGVTTLVNLFIFFYFFGLFVTSSLNSRENKMASMSKYNKKGKLFKKKKSISIFEFNGFKVPARASRVKTTALFMD
jgi:hypothetical protein